MCVCVHTHEGPNHSPSRVGLYSCCTACSNGILLRSGTLCTSSEMYSSMTWFNMVWHSSRLCYVPSPSLPEFVRALYSWDNRLTSLPLAPPLVKLEHLSMVMLRMSLGWSSTCGCCWYCGDATKEDLTWPAIVGDVPLSEPNWNWLNKSIICYWGKRRRKREREKGCNSVLYKTTKYPSLIFFEMDNGGWEKAARFHTRTKNAFMKKRNIYFMKTTFFFIEKNIVLELVNLSLLHVQDIGWAMAFY